MKKQTTLPKTREQFISYIVNRGELTSRREKTLDAYYEDLKGLKK